MPLTKLKEKIHHYFTHGFKVIYEVGILTWYCQACLYQTAWIAAWQLIY
jgi:hypothetical protein